MHSKTEFVCQGRSSSQLVFFWVEMCNLLFGSKLTISRRNRNSCVQLKNAAYCGDNDSKEISV
jgi:hypothetical protein